MKIFKKAICACLVLCIIFSSIVSCKSNKNNVVETNTNTSTNSTTDYYTNSPILSGFINYYFDNIDYGPEPYTAFRCAYITNGSVFDKNEDVSITLYFGADSEERSIEKEPLPNVKICIYSSNKKEETIADMRVDEIFVEDYDFDISYNYFFNNTLQVVTFDFNYSQEIVLSNSFFTENTGFLRIGISHTKETTNDYGYNYQFLHYKKENGKMLLSLHSFS